MDYQDHGFIAIKHDEISSRSPSPDEVTSTPTPRRQSYDLKRTAVPVACLRCRRRKVRCSGLPGPCVTCAKFGVACIDPGKRRARSRSGSGARPWDIFSLQQPELDILQPSPRPAQLRIQTNIWNDAMQAFDDDFHNYPVSPAAYSDMGPELDPVWPQSTPDTKPDYFAGLARAQTFPNQEIQDISMHDEQLHSPIPSIQITSHEGSSVGSPMLQPTFNMPMYVPQQDLPALQVPVSPQMDYYSDYLSPTDQPPAVSRRASMSFGSNTSHVADWTQKTAPAKRRHTTCSLTSPRTVDNTELSWMLNSPRTTNYLKHYMDSVHPRYPFLDTDSTNNRTQADLSPFANSSGGIKTYQRLLTAAIGAMQQHNSRDISARYLRHAMNLQRNEGLELFASISGIHCAMLLAIYLHLESQMDFGPEDEDTSHPDVNLWLWNCRIAAACIDLGLHEWPQSEDDSFSGQQEQQERAMAVLCMNTFQSAWALDREISAYRRRPRALHAEDVDSELLEWILERERERERERAAHGSAALFQHVKREDVGVSFSGLAI